MDDEHAKQMIAAFVKHKINTCHLNFRILPDDYVKMVVYNNLAKFAEKFIDTNAKKIKPGIDVDDIIFRDVVDVLQTKLDSIYTIDGVQYNVSQGKELSKEGKVQQGFEGKSFVYGEVGLLSMAQILNMIKPKSGGVFYDIGSGTGMAIFAMYLLHDFDKYVGIELVTKLNDKAKQVLANYKQNNPNDPDVERIRFIEGDLTKVDWSEADLVLANSTCFDMELIGKISELASKLKPGSHIISFTKQLTHPKLEHMFNKYCQMSWGGATVHVHQVK